MATTAKYEEITFEGMTRVLVKCCSCRAGGYAGEDGWQGAISHGKRCEWLPRQTTRIPAGGAADLNGPVLDPTAGRFARLETDAPAAPVRDRSDWRNARRAARDGQVGAAIDDDDLVRAVRDRAISASAAMNRDD